MKKKLHSLHHKRVGLYAATLAVAVAIPLIPSIGNDIESQLTGALVKSSSNFRVSRRSILTSAEQGTATPNQTQVMRARFYSTDNVLSAKSAKVDLSNKAVSAAQTAALKRIGAKQKELWAVLENPKSTDAQIASATTELAEIKKKQNALSGPLITSTDAPKNVVPAALAPRSETRGSPGTPPSTTPSGTTPAQPAPGTGTPAAPAIPGHNTSSVPTGYCCNNNLCTQGSGTCPGGGSPMTLGQCVSVCASGNTSSSGHQHHLGAEGPMGSSTCSDGDDNNENGFTDLDDESCKPPHSGPGEICNNGIDDDDNGYTDGDDPACPSTNRMPSSSTGMAPSTYTAPAPSTYTTTPAPSPTGMNYSSMGMGFSY